MASLTEAVWRLQAQLKSDPKQVNEMLSGGPCDVAEVRGLSVFLNDNGRRVELRYDSNEDLFEMIL